MISVTRIESVPDPLDYQKPKPDAGRFNILCAVGIALAIIVMLIGALDRFGITPQSLYRLVR